MDAREYLRQIAKLDMKINIQLEDLAMLRTIAEKADSCIYGMPAQGGNPRKLEDVVIRIVDMEAELNRDIDRLSESRREIAKYLDRITDENCRLVLQMHYIQGYTVEEIARRMAYSRSQIYRFNREGLAELQKIVDGL